MFCLSGLASVERYRFGVTGMIRCPVRLRTGCAVSFDGLRIQTLRRWLGYFAYAGFPGVYRAAVGGGVAQPGQRLAGLAVDEDRVRLPGGKGVILAPLTEADQEIEQVFALLGQGVLLVGAATRS